MACITSRLLLLLSFTTLVLRNTSIPSEPEMTHRNICFDICFAFPPPLFLLICPMTPDSHSCVIRRSLSVFTSSLSSILFLQKVSRVWSCHVFVFFLRVSITLFSRTTQTTHPHYTAAVAGKPQNCRFIVLTCSLGAVKVKIRLRI